MLLMCIINYKYFMFFQTLLGESLALEAEKALFNLVCFNTDRAIRMKFIEGCLENIQKNKYVKYL